MSSKVQEAWVEALQSASSSQKDDRAHALLRSCARLEHALAAHRIDTSKVGLAQGLESARAQGLLPDSIPLDEVKRARRARNGVAHGRAVPEREQCVGHILSLFKTWVFLQEEFLRASVVEEILLVLKGCSGIEHVLIFGSYARRDPYPKDVDILLLDDGRHSRILEQQGLSYSDQRSLVEQNFTRLGISEKWIVEAACSGWLDLLILDGRRLSTDSNYLHEQSLLHPDPYFFLDIASDLQVLDESHEVRIQSEGKPQPFGELGRLAASLRDVGLPVNRHALVPRIGAAQEIAEMEETLQRLLPDDETWPPARTEPRSLMGRLLEDGLRALARRE